MHRRTFLAALPGSGIGAWSGVATASRSDPGTTTTTSEATSSLSPRGTLSVDGLSEVVVGPSGEVVYGALREGFLAVDISDPADPTELSRTTGILGDEVGGPVEDIYDVAVSGDRLLVAGPNSSMGGISGFEVYDVGDPANPERIAGRETSHGIHNCYLDGETAYLTGTGAPDEPLVVYDAGGEVAEVARWSVDDAGGAWAEFPAQYRSCHDVTVRDGVAAVAFWDAGTWLLDVSDPASPEPIATVGGRDPAVIGQRGADGGGFPPQVRELPGNSHYAELAPGGDLLAVGKEAWDADGTEVDGGPGGIELWDVSDPATPERLTILGPPTEEPHTSHNFGWRGDRLYASWYGGGVAVYDLADPADPALLGSWAAPETTSFWTARPAAEGFVASSHTDPREGDDGFFDGLGAALYTFPDPESEDPATPSTLTPRPTLTPTTTTGTTSTTRTTSTTTETTTTSTTATTTETTTPPTSATESQSQPGFGIAATVTGVGTAAWGLWRRRKSRSE